MNTYIIMDDYTRAVYTKPLHFKLEDTFKMFKAVVEKKTGNKVCKVLIVG
jgi:hypothetical protein